MNELDQYKIAEEPFYQPQEDENRDVYGSLRTDASDAKRPTGWWKIQVR